MPIDAAVSSAERPALAETLWETVDTAVCPANCATHEPAIKTANGTTKPAAIDSPH